VNVSVLARIGMLLLAIGFACRAAAVEPGEMLADPAREARAREISRGLRCLVCQNESIDESNADLARDLRKLVRERIAAGDSDAEVVGYVVSRYGDFVLLEPPFKPATYALWLGPPMLLAIAIAALVLFYRRRAAGSAGGAPLSAADEERLARLFEDRKP
jgi:cytochrome c-type biogenesis protein CcmH